MIMSLNINAIKITNPNISIHVFPLASSLLTKMESECVYWETEILAAIIMIITISWDGVIS
jgi:hypothetical protein